MRRLIHLIVFFTTLAAWQAPALADMPDTPPDDALKVSVARYGQNATHYFWDDGQDMYVRVEPGGDRFFACGFDWRVIQDGEDLGQMRFELESGASLCGDITRSTTYFFTNWSYNPAPDISEPMTLVYTDEDGEYGRYTYPPSAEPVANSTYVVPAFSVGGGTWTGLGLTNVNGTDAVEVKTTLYDGEGWVQWSDSRSLPAKGQAAFAVGGDAAQGQEASTGWIGIESTGPLSGLAFMGLATGTGEMVDVPFTDEPSKKLVIPHVAQDQTWDTVIHVANPGEFMTGVTLYFHDSNGTLRYSEDFLIWGRGAYSMPAKTLVRGSNQPSGSVRISSDTPVAAFAIYSNRKSGGGSVAGITADPL